MFERVFKLSEHKTTVKTEVMAGITTFMTMAYILAVNPSVLGSTGMDTTAVLLATALASCLGTLCMAFMANLPFALSAGMGLNAFMAYTVVAGYGYSWHWMRCRRAGRRVLCCAPLPPGTGCPAWVIGWSCPGQAGSTRPGPGRWGCRCSNGNFCSRGRAFS